MPRLLNTKASVSNVPMPRAIQRTLPRGRCIGSAADKITAAVKRELVRRIIHTACTAPTRGTMRIPSSQNKNPNPTAATMARPMPRVLAFVGCREFSTAYERQRSEEHMSELQSRLHLVCRLLLEKKNNTQYNALINQVDRY